MGVIWAPSNTVQICGTKSKNQHFLCKYCGRMYSLMQYLHRSVNISSKKQDYITSPSNTLTEKNVLAKKQHSTIKYSKNY